MHSLESDTTRCIRSVVVTARLCRGWPRLGKPKSRGGPSFVGIDISGLDNNLTPSLLSCRKVFTPFFCSLQPFLLLFSSSSLLSMDNTHKPIFHSTGRKSLMGNAVHEAFTGFRRNRRPETCRRRTRRKSNDLEAGQKEHVDEDEGEDKEEKAAVESKIAALQKIVPGGETLGVDELFEETAEYILALQCQIKAMRVLSSFIVGLGKEERKLGC